MIPGRQRVQSSFQLPLSGSRQLRQARPKDLSNFQLPLSGSQRRHLGLSMGRLLSTPSLGITGFKSPAEPERFGCKLSTPSLGITSLADYEKVDFAKIVDPFNSLSRDHSRKIRPETTRRGFGFQLPLSGSHIPASLSRS